MTALITAATMAQEINALVATIDVSDYCIEARLARARDRRVGVSGPAAR